MSTFGVIIGNRGFFPDVLARDGREEILRVLGEQGHKAFCLTPEESKQTSAIHGHIAKPAPELGYWVRLAQVQARSVKPAPVLEHWVRPEQVQAR